MFFVGIDPDLHCTGVVFINDRGEVTFAAVLKVPRTLKGRDACAAMAQKISNALSDNEGNILAVEGQEFYRGTGQESDTQNPRSIMFLAAVAGAALGVLMARTYFPSPQEWKGNVPKQIHQARTLNKVGWVPVKAGTDPRKGYCYPQHLPYGLNKGDWKHVSDALGLALWAKEKYESDQRKQAVMQGIKT